MPPSTAQAFGDGASERFLKAPGSVEPARLRDVGTGWIIVYLWNNPCFSHHICEASSLLLQIDCQELYLWEFAAP